MPAADNFNTVVIIFNPASTNAQHLKRRIKELKTFFSNGTPIHTVETSADGRAANQALIRKHRKLLGPQTLLCIAAGDGTVNMVLDTLLTDKVITKSMRHF